jgi:hypothetical protein
LPNYISNDNVYFPIHDLIYSDLFEPFTNNFRYTDLVEPFAKKEGNNAAKKVTADDAKKLSELAEEVLGALNATKACLVECDGDKRSGLMLGAAGGYFNVCKICLKFSLDFNGKQTKTFNQLRRLSSVVGPEAAKKHKTGKYLSLFPVNILKKLINLSDKDGILTHKMSEMLHNVN